MSAVRTGGNVIPLRSAAAPQPQLLLLGTGTVGSAFARRYAQLRERLALPPLALIANSRSAEACHADPVSVLASVAASQRCRGALQIDPNAFARGDIVVDASASDHVADLHARWLERGVHVVTANKLGAGAGLERALDILHAQDTAQARYADAATVGAGLPLIRSIRALAQGGDRIRSVEGVLSGSLAWLFNRYDGTRPFSSLVREARDAGYTEPDPRMDLSGEDVRRKLLILARAAGLRLHEEEIQVESLVPAALADASPDDADALLSTLDTPLLERFRQSRRAGEVLRFVGKFAVDGAGKVSASVGLRALPAAHPLCGGSGTDNIVAIHSCRYEHQPLVIQGPGAGAEVTAAALLDDVIAIAEAGRRFA